MLFFSRHLDKPSLVTNVLSYELSSLNPYNYEALSFIKDSLENSGKVLLAQADPAEQVRIRGLDQILGFLRQYERVSEPTEIEMRLWNETKGGALPDISKFR